jgi:DNA-binding NarL/FixJ family response regulator
MIDIKYDDFVGSSQLSKLDASSTILIVDDEPANLAALHEALDLTGYRVLVAANGKIAIDCINELQPDLILLDALMPILDGFETCRRVKANPISALIPIIFMTGLTDSDHILQGFRCGGVDYVTKPIKIDEVLARVATHLHTSLQASKSRNAIDAVGHAMLLTDISGLLQWMSPLAREWLKPNIGAGNRLSSQIVDWLKLPIEDDRSTKISLMVGDIRFNLLRLEGKGREIALLLSKDNFGLEESQPENLILPFNLTTREAEVLYWVAFGKTNRDIGEILNIGTRTVDKHVQHIFVKLNVETRTRAASLALSHLNLRP